MRRKPSYLLPGVVEVIQSPVTPLDGFRLGVTGGRDFDDSRFIWESLLSIHRKYEITELGSGCAAGVDDIAVEWAVAHKVPWRVYVADWDTYGNAAGTIRNGVYLEDFRPDLLAVFLGGTGTQNCSKQAKKMGIERVFLNDLNPLEEAQRWG